MNNHFSCTVMADKQCAKIAVHILCFGVDKYLEACVRNCQPHVDAVYLAWSPLSWSYTQPKVSNPTDIYAYDFDSTPCPVVIVEGNWDTEEDMRNSCLERARADGHDWLIVQDADEFYCESDYCNIIAFLRHAPPNVSLVKTSWYQFWKNPSYVIEYANGSIKTTNALAALRCDGSATFVRKRISSAVCGQKTVSLDASCFHYGYVMSDTEMLLKLRTWGHSVDFNARKWYDLKWARWNLDSRNLAPINPPEWRKAIWFPLGQPPFAFDVFGSKMAISECPSSGSSISLGLSELAYDIHHSSLHSIKKFVKQTGFRQR